jgi:hypothetical protein
MGPKGLSPNSKDPTCDLYIKHITPDQILWQYFHKNHFIIIWTHVFQRRYLSPEDGVRISLRNVVGFKKTTNSTLHRT